jgi:RNA polymerase sigma-70 factor (ECF subfamily)
LSMTALLNVRYRRVAARPAGPPSADWQMPISIGLEACLASYDADFVRFVQEIEADLTRTTRRLAPIGVDPQDLAAEALARAYARWGQLGGLEYRRAWVFRVVTNLALSAHSSGRRGALSFRRWAEMAPPSEGRNEDDVVDRELMRAAMRKLPERQRQAVTLHYFADLPLADVARTMGVSSETAKTHVGRGISALRSSLGAKAEVGLHD